MILCTHIDNADVQPVKSQSPLPSAVRVRGAIAGRTIASDNPSVSIALSAKEHLASLRRENLFGLVQLAVIGRQPAAPSSGGVPTNSYHVSNVVVGEYSGRMSRYNDVRAIFGCDSAQE